MANEATGIGTIFYRWDGSAWVAVSNIKSIDGPGTTRETVDTTTLDTTGGYRTFIGGLRDGGEISLSMNFLNATYQIMLDDLNDDDVQSYRIVLDDASDTILEFDGLVTACPLSITPDDVISSDVTIKISGEPTIEES